MTMTEELIEQFNKLDEVQQQRLLNFARILTKTPVVHGEPGHSIVQATNFFDSNLKFDVLSFKFMEDCVTIKFTAFIHHYPITANSVITFHRVDSIIFTPRK